MMKHQTEIICAVSILLGLSPFAAAFEVFPVWAEGNVQESPDVDNGKVVWAEWVEGENEEWDWDVYGVDLLDVSGEKIYVAADIGTDQKEPSIWNNRVVFQDDYFGDWDVYVSDISDAGNPVPYPMTLYEQDYFDDQTHPAIHGNTAVWRSYVEKEDDQGGTFTDWDIIIADITEPNTPSVFVVDDYAGNQQAPAVYRNRIVYQDDYNVDWDIFSADIWLKNSPEYSNVIADIAALNQENPAVWGDTVVCQVDAGSGNYDILSVDISEPDSPFVTTIATGASVQKNPDISGHLVVWQDDRNGNFDIYGYNLITREEFQITTDITDQTNPAISGSLVVWEDLRDVPDKPMQIYAAWLDGDVIANCPDKLTGDLDGDCRVNLTDYSLMAKEWLGCALDPITACTD